LQIIPDKAILFGTSCVKNKGCLELGQGNPRIGAETQISVVPIPPTFA
jgi:hypothetical protein